MAGFEKEKLITAKEIVGKISQGINPLNGNPIEDKSFLHEGKIVRCLNLVLEILESSLKGPLHPYPRRVAEFVITEEEKSRIDLPKGKIGINQFAKCVNEAIDPDRSRKLSGMEINKKLKEMGILGEESLEEGKKRTVICTRSHEYGIESETRTHNGNTYEMILFNEKGKRFLLENLEAIMQFEG